MSVPTKFAINLHSGLFAHAQKSKKCYKPKDKSMGGQGHSYVRLFPLIPSTADKSYISEVTFCIECFDLLM